MSIGVLQTPNVHVTPSENFTRGLSPPKTAQVSPRAQQGSPARRRPTTPNLNDAKGLGISTPSLAWLQDGANTSLDTADVSVPTKTSTSSSKEYLQRLQESRDRITELRKKLGGAVFASDTSGDGSSSAASSFKKRSSVDSSVTAVSTAPTTTGARTSITSTLSGAVSSKFYLDSSPSTPSRSRSPSPPDQSSKAEPHTFQNGATLRTSSGPRERSPSKRKGLSRRSNGNTSENGDYPSSDEQSGSLRKLGMLRHRSTASVTGLFKSSISENEDTSRPRVAGPPVPPLPKSFSSGQISSLSPPLASQNHLSPIPRPVPAGRSSSISLATPKEKDELWTVFRNLEADFQKFTTKSLAHKASVVRNSLVPFLRSYATHPSNRALRVEDLDRRVNILNKWWTGLIDLLHGQNNQSISGSDRPAILDGISGIMDRPEWRSAPSPFCPLDQRANGMPSPRNHSKSSLSSSTSDFLAESVHHNVRNIFIHNLTAQMDFVVDKMAMRNVPASLVTFCGKACAYAFVFVPGMADVLVRLWELQVGTLHRVLQGNGIGKFEDMSSAASTIVSEFPPALQSLGFSSAAKYMRKLRTPPQLPVGTSNIQWWGQWLERWSGRDSDLFYVFVKNFYVLVSDFLPTHVMKKERLCVPGLLLVQAQILVNLDATLHRSSNQPQQDQSTGAPKETFDDLLADPDAVASTVPIPPSNASRLMAENRLVMIIRDFLSLSERANHHSFARQLFAESVSDLLQTAARGCSLFDHAACYTLIDFLEETLVLLVRFERLKCNKETIVDFEFWKTVWKKMISSQNTLTEIKLFSFLYTIWNTVICESGLKADICFNFLLTPETFESMFCHWCPTVRAYFLRLMCWRVARPEGDYSSVDSKILQTLGDRLQTSWSYHLYLQEQAERNSSVLPPTNPCNPIPARRLRIVRTDNPIGVSRGLLPADNMMTPSNDSTPSTLKRNSIISQSSLYARPDSSLSNSDSEAEQRGRGFGGFLRNLIGNKTRSKSQQTPARPKPHESASAPELPKNTVRSESRNGNIAQPQRPSSPPKTVGVNSTPHQKFTFKFALEYLRSTQPMPPMRLSPPRLPLPAQEFLTSFPERAQLATANRPLEPKGSSKAHAKYCGHALAEWTMLIGECQSFFERRKNEGVPSNNYVETPTLGVEVFRKPG